LQFDKLAISLAPSSSQPSVSGPPSSSSKTSQGPSSSSSSLTDLTPLSSLSSTPSPGASFPFHLQFEGVSHFSHKVLYASLCEDNAVKFLRAVSTVMARHMVDAGVVITNSKELLPSEAKAPPVTVTEEVDTQAAGEKRQGRYMHGRKSEAKGFTPHLTIAKFSRTFPKHKHPKFKKRRHEDTAKEAGKEADGQQQQEDHEHPSNSPQPVSDSVTDAKVDEPPVDEKEESQASNPDSAMSQPQLPLPKKFVPETYQSFLAHRFGTQPLLTFDLCSMQHKKQEDGYYHVVSSITLSNEEKLVAPAESTAPTERDAKPTL